MTVIKRVALAFLLLGLPALAFGQAQFSSKLDGAQENPPVTTDATGTGCFTLSSEGLHFFITVDDLSGPITAAHFHVAKRGENGGVVRTITSDFLGGHTAEGLWSPSDSEPLDAAAIAALLSGKVYVNIHTAMNPGGEIRGQLDVSGGAHFTADLTGAQENPNIASPASGTASLTLTSQGLEYKITVTDLSGPITAAHIHTGTIGVNGGVEISVLSSFTGNTAEGIWLKNGAPPLSPGLIRELMRGNLYINIHTAAAPGGEIRGQILLSSGFGLSSNLDGDQEVPPSGEPGMGTGSFTLTSEGLKFHVTACNLTGPITAAHFHEGSAGVNGPVVRDITSSFVGNTATGFWSPQDSEALTPELICSLLAGKIYVNIHTAAHPSGEIRGQVLLNTGNTTLTACLTAEQEEPPTGVSGRGTGTFRLTPFGLEYDITVAGLTGPITAAHIHFGPIGLNGGVALDLGPAFGQDCTAHGTWKPDDTPPFDLTAVKELLKGNFYVNVHTAAHPSGEIRGQILLESGCGFQMPLTPEQEVPPATSNGTGTGSCTLTPYGLVFNITADNLTGPLTAAHFHNAKTGTGGGVVRDIAAEFTGTHAEGVWSPADAMPLTSVLVDEVLIGNVYANLHTAMNPPGEVRGQALLSEGFYFGGNLRGSQEVPPVSTDGSGTGAVTITEQSAVFSLTASNLSGFIMSGHFHNAPLGANGPVEFDFSSDFVGNTAIGTWRASDATPLTQDLICEFLRCNMYLNVHTSVNPSGEIRGQLCGRTAADAEEPVTTEALRLLLQNHPNPFAGRTSLSFQLPEDDHVTLKVFNVEGEEVMTLVDGDLPAGRHEVRMDSRSLSGGVYFYRLEAGNRVESRKMIVRR
jgi:Cu/Zn superoxide dismutase